jgi:hypothetical protein
MRGPINVYPLDDLVFHVLTKDCPCEPTLIVEDGHVKVIIHHAWDEREKYEEGSYQADPKQRYIH